MNPTRQIKWMLILILAAIPSLVLLAQPGITWSADGTAYYKVEDRQIVRYDVPSMKTSTVVTRQDLTPKGADKSLALRAYYFTPGQKQLLVYTNSKRVWRLDTQGDYWVLDLTTRKLQQLGYGLKPSSLRFAKISPDGQKAAYVSENHLYLENLADGKIQKLTPDGPRKTIYGTFDWVYEEEFSCRDGFQWSPDSKHLSFWKIDANRIRDYLMLNTTDSVYSRVVPVEYPKVGESPSPASIGIYTLANGQTTWLNLPGDPQQHYLPRMEWRTEKEIFVQQLNRKQNQSVVFSCSLDGTCTPVLSEQESTWIDVNSIGNGHSLTFRHSFPWLGPSKDFLWESENDGWRHYYRVSATGKRTLITTGAFDVIDPKFVDDKAGVFYYTASPDNATQQYLYKSRLDGKGKPEKVTPEGLKGTHDYTIAPGGKFAWHTFSNANTKSVSELIDLTTHKALNENESIAKQLPAARQQELVEFFKVRTEEGVEMDGWVVKPANFDPAKKYPVVFYVYTEPASQTVTDRFGAGMNNLYEGDMREDGYLYVSLDGRGTPAPKGKQWRKSIYRQIGRINIRDQALAAKEVLKWPYADASRVAVWGWSGGGSTTLNLLFQYPEIYQTGIAVAAVGNQLTYDNIYQERYMGIPQENREDFVAGSPVTHAGNLRGNLLYIHGTGDDNVHYDNAEMLVNELIRHKKVFQFMAYPNRSHGIYEGEGTREHLSLTYTEFLKRNCVPGGR